MANIAALKDTTSVLETRITMDISKERTIKMEYKDKIYKFKECQDRLYYYDTAAKNSISGAADKSNFPITPHSFLSNVE